MSKSQHNMVLRRPVRTTTDSRNAPLPKVGWRSWFGFKFRRQQFKPEARKHLDELRYHRGQENHHSKSCKQRLTKQPQNHSVNTATKTNMGRHKKIGWQGNHHTVYTIQNDLIFPCYMDSLSFLSSLWSHPWPTFKLLTLERPNGLATGTSVCKHSRMPCNIQRAADPTAPPAKHPFFCILMPDLVFSSAAQ